jgi:hypothetical protein
MGVQQIAGINARYMWTKSVATTASDTFSRSIPAQWSLLSLPRQPVSPDPAAVFGSTEAIDSRLYAWDGCTQSLLLYDMWAPDAFGALSPSVGYWLNALEAMTISYTGFVESTPILNRWINAPGPGWKITGAPFLSPANWSTWGAIGYDSAADKMAAKSLFDASQYGAGWLQSTGYWWDETTQSLVDFGLPDDWPTTDQLNQWHGYWVKTNQNVALTAPAQ